DGLFGPGPRGLGARERLPHRVEGFGRKEHRPSAAASRDDPAAPGIEIGRAAGRRLLPAGDASPELGGVTEAAEEPEVEREDLGLAGLAAIELAEEVLDAREDLLVGQPLRRELL